MAIEEKANIDTLLIAAEVLERNNIRNRRTKLSSNYLFLRSPVFFNGRVIK